MTNFRQTVCATCDFDIEGDLDEPLTESSWRDRGGNWSCAVTPQHTPVLDPYYRDDAAYLDKYPDGAISTIDYHSRARR